MSFFLPPHTKTYFSRSPQRPRKKKKKKKRKKQSESVQSQYHSQRLQDYQKSIHPDSPIPNPVEILSPIPEQQESQINLSIPLDKPPLVSTYYDNLHMFSKGESHKFKTQMVGKKAKLDFVESYKYLNSPKFNDSKTASPVLKYLNKIDEKKLTPIPMGVFKRKGNIRELDIGMYSIGNRYAEALSEGIQLLTLTKVQLNDNRLTEDGIKNILASLSVENLMDLNISNNKASVDNLKTLAGFVASRFSVLKILKLEGMNLKDQGCAIICKALKKNQTLLELNLAKNSIEGNKTLCSYISQTQTLQKLDLHWNLIRSQGAYSLSESILSNSTLKVLDLSWNSLGSLSKVNGIKILAHALEKHKSLIHVDISNNNLATADVEIIAKKLEKNHKILGIHMSGNHADVNELGFISSIRDDRPSSAVKFKRMLGFSRISNNLSWRTVSNCWICERWSPVEFQWTGEKTDPVYLHLSFDDFDGDLLAPPDYKITRMCPPGKFYYVFSVNGVPATLDKNIESISSVEKSFQKTPDQMVTLKFSKVNTITGNTKGPDLLSVLNDNSPLPRIPLRKYQPKIAKKEWNVADSIFKDYKIDSPELLGKCFEYDWAKCKVPRLIKDQIELQKIKDMLSSRYNVIKEIYKYYSSISPSGEIWSIGQMVFTDICNESKLLDNNFRLSDIDFHLKGALFQEVRNPRSPPNSLVRFQFMEILVRIALDKYFKSGICTSQSQAVLNLMDNNIILNLGHVSAQKWRSERYFFMSVETVIKANMALLQYTYSSYSSKKVKPGQKPFMCLEEFNDIILKANMLNENFTAREIAIAFNLAMMTQVQELDTDRQYQMIFIEFLEAISRVADMICDPKKPLSQNLEQTLPKLIPTLSYSIQKELSRQNNI